ncbi:unnamed protein product [Ilex paraguariensis]|uniref:Major facilitator superfamily (MFS) profile domain-containing protein n=1 Tax=Ilex paraguariensis TaxID=185542 RepID=A0ABC8V3Y0_9AQUA
MKPSIKIGHRGKDQMWLGMANFFSHGCGPSLNSNSGGTFSPRNTQQLNSTKQCSWQAQTNAATDDVQAELDDLIKASGISKTIKYPFKNIIRAKYRPQLVMSITIPFFQQVTGINVISFYAPVLFRTIGFGESASLLSLLIVDKVGRSFLFIVGGSQMFVSQMLIGGLMAAKLGDHGGLSKGDDLLVLILICIYVAGFGLSRGPLGWLVPTENFPLEIRSAAQSITVAVGFFFIFLVAQTFLAMLCHFKFGIFFFFGGWLAVMTGFVCMLLPETKNVPIEQMYRIWREHWFWKAIVADGHEVSKMESA